MRSLVLLAAVLCVPGPALAGSFTTISDRAVGADSIMSIGVPAPKAAAPAPKAATLAPGSEKIRLESSNGTTKIYRTEAWLGGSPVTYVTTGSEADLALLKNRGIDVAASGEQLLAPDVLPAAAPAGAPQVAGVDSKETTGSVDDAKTASPEARAEPAVRPLDAGSLKLRPLTNS